MKKDSAGAEGPVASTADASQASPYKSAVEELDALRKTFRLTCQHYARRIDMEIIRLRERVAGAGDQRTAADGETKAAAGRNRAREARSAGSHIHDLRDMTTLLRMLDVKPLAGRRKDLKKIESLVDELRLLIERWE